MNVFLRNTCAATLAVAMLPIAAPAQNKPARRRASATTAPAVTAEDIKALRDAIVAQQQQLDLLRQELAKRDQAQLANEEAAHSAQAAAQQAASTAAAAKAAADGSVDSISKMSGDVSDLKTNTNTVALNSQDTDKRIAGIEGTLGRFRWSGDMRVRGESFMQDIAGCTSACNDRYRARIRARFGFESRLNDDFAAGIFLATGGVVNGAPDFKDPTSTNETLTSFFERKPMRRSPASSNARRSVSIAAISRGSRAA
jgi:hypothetical protein